MIALIALALVACGSTTGPTGAGTGPSPAVSPSASTPAVTPTPSAAPSPTSAPTPTPGTAAACWPYRGGTSASASIVDMRVGAHDGYDRLVFEYDRAVPFYEMMPNQAPPGGGTDFTGSFSGLPIHVDGSYGVSLLLSGLAMPDQYPHGIDLKPGYPVLKEVRLLGDAEGTASFALGLSGNVCPRVWTADNPARLVIDFPTG